jgi:hypothetical protein
MNILDFFYLHPFQVVALAVCIGIFFIIVIFILNYLPFGSK